MFHNLMAKRHVLVDSETPKPKRPNKTDNLKWSFVYFAKKMGKDYSVHNYAVKNKPLAVDIKR